MDELKEYISYHGIMAAKYIHYTYLDGDKEGQIVAKTEFEVCSLIFAKITGEDKQTIQQRWIREAFTELEETRQHLAQEEKKY